MVQSAILNFYHLRNGDEWEKEISNMGIDISDVTTIDLDNSNELIAFRQKLYSTPFYSEWGIEPNYDLFPEYSLDVKSFVLMQAFAASYEAMASYVVQKETELFMKRYDYLLRKKKTIDTNKMQNVLFLDEIRYPNNKKVYADEESIPKTERDYLTNNLRVKWYWVSPKAFLWEKCEIKRGWIVIPNPQFNRIESDFSFKGVIEYAAQVMFRESLTNFRINMTEEQIENYRSFAMLTFTDIVDYASFSATFDDVDNIVQKSPMCIVQLDNQMKTIGLNNHWYALQVSFYMKQFLEKNDLIKYFWQRDVRNRGYPTIDAFIDGNMELNKKFEYIYDRGKYKPLGCKKSIVNGYCLYENSSAELIEAVLTNAYKDSTLPKATIDGFINRIISHAQKNQFYSACALESCLRAKMSEMEARKMHKNGKLFVNYPLDYYTFLDRATAEKKSEGDEAEEAAKALKKIEATLDQDDETDAILKSILEDEDEDIKIADEICDRLLKEKELHATKNDISDEKEINFDDLFSKLD